MDILTVIGYAREMEQSVKPRLVSLSTIYTIFAFYASPYLIHHILKPTLSDTLHTADCRSLHQYLLHKLKESQITNDKIREGIDYIIDYAINILVVCQSVDRDDQLKLFRPTFEFFQTFIRDTTIPNHKEICAKLRTVLIENTPKPKELLKVYETSSESTPFINELLWLLAKNDSKGMRKALEKIAKNSSVTFNGVFDLRFTNACKVLWCAAAVSGAFSKREENSFLTTTVQFALRINKKQSIRETRMSIIASVFYLNSKYTRFLFEHENSDYLKTIIKKCFEFIHMEDIYHNYLQNMVISSLNRIFSDRECSAIYLSEERWNELINHCKNIWMLDMDQKEKLYESIAVILSHEQDSNKSLQYLSELNAAFCRFPKNNNMHNTVHPPIHANYVCIKCKSVGEHWIMDCNSWFNRSKKRKLNAKTKRNPIITSFS